MPSISLPSGCCSRRTDLLLFESAYGQRRVRGQGRQSTALAPVSCTTASQPMNSIPIAPVAQAADLVFVGELRLLKGVDVLIEAVAILSRQGKKLTATIVGDGPDRGRFEALAAALGSRTVSTSWAQSRRAKPLRWAAL